MTSRTDSLPIFCMRRSRRARQALQDLLARNRIASPPAGERHPPLVRKDEAEAEPSGERARLRPRLPTLLSLLCASAALALFGEGLWIKAKAELAQILLDRAFAQSIATGRPVKPWRWADTWPIARISVPRLQTTSIVLAGSSGQALAFGPGHLDQTPRPGERGTAVFAAHRDTHFSFLGELKAGDEIKVTRNDGITFTYEMTGADVVRWNETNIDAGAHGYNLALATCWPLDGAFGGPLRYVVHARLKPQVMFGDTKPGVALISAATSSPNNRQSTANRVISR
ncbi:class GN sortase [Taklimakanibacter lacteus]|uniref:class GN sortase n=1 Tax=Taklimakanibacter lacteus TaxID=2268456 RepID=UPI0034D64930